MDMLARDLPEEVIDCFATETGDCGQISKAAGKQDIPIYLPAEKQQTASGVGERRRRVSRPRRARAFCLGIHCTW